MNICIIIPDSFKGTLSSFEISQIEKEEVLKVFPNCSVTAIPVADGGEGTCDCFLNAVKESRKVHVNTSGPYGEKLSVYYVRIGDTAIIESAMCAGLSLVEGKENPKVTTTFGVGLIIKKAALDGCKKIVIGLGGSCTNDCGAGMAAALGVIFKNKDAESFIPVGDTLKDVASIDTKKARELLSGIKISAMCDVKNPLYGKNGAAYIFAPQKGANKEDVIELDGNLTAFSNTIKNSLGIDVSNLCGGGAAGGMGVAVSAFLGGNLKSGIDTVLDIVGFESLLDGADMVFTGEGCIDGQSVGGKVISGIAKRAKNKNVPVICVVGSIGEGYEKAYDIGVTAIFSINRKAEDFKVSRFKSKENLKSTMSDILRFSKIFEK